MDLIHFDFWGKTKHWWLVTLIGVLMIPCGFVYWIFPIAGYAVASQLFGWMLVLAGCVQLAVGGGVDKVPGKAWWIIGGIIDIFIGFMLIRSVILSETVLPYFLAFIFIYWGISAIISSFMSQRNKYWWLHLINGILLSAIGFFFLEGGYLSNMTSIDFLISLAFIYWGISLCFVSFEIRPNKLTN